MGQTLGTNKPFFPPKSTWSCRESEQEGRCLQGSVKTVPWMCGWGSGAGAMQEDPAGREAGEGAETALGACTVSP